MSTGNSQADFAEFCDFLGSLRQSGRNDLSPEQSVSEFRTYQQQLAEFQAANAEAVEQCERGEARELNVEALIKRVHERLAADSEQR